MRELNLTLETKGKKALYLKIASSLRESIRSGHLRPGEAIPSTRSIAASVKAHRHTVMAALDELVAEGWLISKQRSAYRVCETLPSSFHEAKRRAGKPLAQKPHSWKLARISSLPPVVPLERMKFNFKSGIPDLRLFPQQEFKSCLNDSIRRSGAKLLDYGEVEGHGPFVTELKTYLRRMRALTNREIIVTHGSQEAIFLIGQLLLFPGDRVGVEALGYPPAFEALRATGAELVPVRVDREGLDPDHLECVLRRGGVKLLYLTPLHQFPTTVSLSMPRRLRLYELACKYEVPILEDDYDHEYHYRCQPLAPLASDDPAGLVIYVSTFSKIFSPSARLGFMAIPPVLLPRLGSLKRVVSRQNDLLIQDALARWMRSGGFERHLRRTRRCYEERRDTLIECLSDARDRGAGLSWDVPDGGMAVWVRTGGDSARLAESARAVGVHIGHEAEFRAQEGRGNDSGSGIRLAFARSTPAEIRQGMSRLVKLL